MELPDKTQSAAPAKKVITPVVSTAQVVGRPATRRFFDFLFAESPKALVSKVARDVLVPRAKAGMEEALNSFISGMFWGEGSNRPTSGLMQGTVLRGGVVNYSGVSSMNPNMLQARQSVAGAHNGGGYQDLVLSTQQEAEILLANMFDLHNQYRVVAVGDLYELAGLTPDPAMNAYGWTSFDSARISKVRNGYVLELPRPTLI